MSDVAGCVGRLRWAAAEAREAGETQPEAVHLLPCCIAYNGVAPVSQFFKPTDSGVSADGVPFKEAAFRGRKLLGSTVTPAPGFCGLVLEKDTQDPETSLEFDSWKARAVFRELTYWNHDTVPSTADPARRCVEWLQVANMMQELVSEEDVACMMEEQNLASGAKRKSEVICLD